MRRAQARVVDLPVKFVQPAVAAGSRLAFRQQQSRHDKHGLGQQLHTGTLEGWSRLIVEPGQRCRHARRQCGQSVGQFTGSATIQVVVPQGPQTGLIGCPADEHRDVSATTPSHELERRFAQQSTIDAWVE